MRRLFRASAFCAALLPCLVVAQTTSPAQGALPIQASVINACRILSVDGLVFGVAYNPVSNPVGSSAVHEGQIHLICTAGTTGFIGADSGAHAPSGMSDACTSPIRRLMGHGNPLGYTLTFQSGGVDTTWGCDAAHAPGFAAMSVHTPISVGTKATIPGGQDVPPGDYADAVMISITF